MPYNINNRVFKTTTQARDYAKQILGNGIERPGTILSSEQQEFMLAYFQYFHPDWKYKFGSGVKFIRRTLEQKFHKYMFFELHRHDGTFTDITYSTTAKNEKSITPQPKVIAPKKINQVEKWVKKVRVHVQHHFDPSNPYEPILDVLVAEFMKENIYFDGNLDEKGVYAQRVGGVPFYIGKTAASISKRTETHVYTFIQSINMYAIGKRVAMTDFHFYRWLEILDNGDKIEVVRISPNPDDEMALIKENSNHRLTNRLGVPRSFHDAAAREMRPEIKKVFDKYRKSKVLSVVG